MSKLASVAIPVVMPVTSVDVKCNFSKTGQIYFENFKGLAALCISMVTLNQRGLNAVNDERMMLNIMMVLKFIL